MDLPAVKIKKILYATDLSKGARSAFAYAVSLANTYNASITILHVIYEDHNIDSVASFYIGEEEWLKIKKRTYDDARDVLIGKKRDDIAIEEILQKFTEKAKFDGQAQNFVTDEIIVKHGTPEEHILDQAKERDCDIIVMGNHAHGALEEAVLGSTVHRVMRRSKIPVFVVPLPKIDPDEKGI